MLPLEFHEIQTQLLRARSETVRQFTRNLATSSARSRACRESPSADSESCSTETRFSLVMLLIFSMETTTISPPFFCSEVALATDWVMALMEFTDIAICRADSACSRVAMLTCWVPL